MNFGPVEVRHQRVPHGEVQHGSAERPPDRKDPRGGDASAQVAGEPPEVHRGGALLFFLLPDFREVFGGFERELTSVIPRNFRCYMAGF